MLALVGTQLGAQSLRANLNSAKSSLSSKDWDDAILSAKAALIIDNSHQEAYYLLHSAYAGAGTQSKAILAAVDCYDAPPKDKKKSKGIIKKVRKFIKISSSTLNEFLDLRANTARDLMKTRKSAQKAKQHSDVEWIELIAFRLAPTDATVLKGTSRRGEKFWRLRGHGGSKPLMEEGFVSLLSEPDDWKLFDVSDDGRISADKIVIMPREHGYIGIAFLPKDEFKTASGFTLRYSFKWTKLKDPPSIRTRVYAVFMKHARPSASDVFVTVTFDDKSPSVSFARNTKGQGLRPVSESVLEAGSVGEGKWIDVEISWSKLDGKLRVKHGGKTVLTTSPKEFGPENMYVGFGAGTVADYSIKEPRIKVSKVKKDN